jgi:hypothetical protein
MMFWDRGIMSLFHKNNPTNRTVYYMHIPYL